MNENTETETEKTKDDLFAEATASRQEKRVEKEKASGTSNTSKANWDEIHYTALKPNEYKVIRLLGNPYDRRNGDSESPKVILHSMVLGDDNKIFRCIWPDPLEGDNKKWIMWRIINKILASRFDQQADKWVYYNEKDHPELFKKVNKNNKDAKNTYERGWYPGRSLASNVIDRDQLDWHKENKHSFLFSKKESNSGFYELGIPFAFFNESINKSIIEVRGNPENYNVVVVKLEEKPWYKAWHGANKFDLSVLDKKFDDAFFEDSMAPLTDEEQSWEKYDIDQLFPIAYYGKIKYRLSEFFQQVDEEFNTHFYEELCDLASEEKNSYTSEKSSTTEVNRDKSSKSLNVNDFEDDTVDTDEFIETTEDTTTVQAPSVFDDVPDIQETPETPEVPERRSAKKPDIAIDWDALSESFPGIKKMTDKHKALVVAYDEKAGQFIYKDGLKVMKCSNGNCKMTSTADFDFCPGCGVEFES